MGERERREMARRGKEIGKKIVGRKKGGEEKEWNGEGGNIGQRECEIYCEKKKNGKKDVNMEKQLKQKEKS